MTAEKTTRRVGRPSDYDPAYCEQIVDYMGQGYSLTAFAGHIGHHRETLLNWGREHAEFFDAIKRGKAARTRCLEEGLLSSEVGPRVTARIFALKNAAPEEWKDKVAIVGGGPGDAPVRVDLSGLSDEELEALERIRSKLADAGGDQGGEASSGG